MENANISVKPHRFIIITYLLPYLTLLIAPAVRGLLTFRETGVLTRVIIGEVMAALLAVGFAIFKYMLCEITVTDTELVYKRGLFLRTKTVIPLDKIALTAGENNPVYALFRVVKVQVYTDAGFKGGSELSIPLKKNEAERIINILGADTVKRPPDRRYKCPFWRVLLYAAATSSAATGLLIAVPIINRTGSMVGEALDSLLVEKVFEFSQFIPKAVPRVAGVISIFLLLGYGISLVNSLLKNAGFEVGRKGTEININAGLLPRRRIVFDLKDVRATVTRQNILMRLLRVESVKMSVGGYGEKRGESPVILPAVTKKERERIINGFAPDLPPVTRNVRSVPSLFFRSFTLPFFIMLIIISARWLLLRMFPRFADVTRFAAFVSLIFDIVYGFCQWIRCRTGGYTLTGEYLTCSGGRFFAFGTVTAKTNDIEEIVVTRLPLDRLYGMCRVTFKIRDKNRDRIMVGALRFNDVVASLHDFYGVSSVSGGGK